MNILIGYGNSLCRDFVQNHLTFGDSSVNIVTVGTVKELIEITKDNIHLDVIGLDLEMPDMEGLDSLAKVRNTLFIQSQLP